MKYYYLGLFLFFIGGLLSIPLPEKHKGRFVSLFSGLGTIFLLTSALNIILNNKIVSKSIFFPDPIGQVNFVIDPLSAFFILVISVMSFIGTLYAIGYIKPYLYKNKLISSHFFFLSTLIVSMLLVVTVQNALFFLIVWEIMSLSSFFLVIFENEKKEVMSAGIYYLITMHISVLFLIAGFIILSLKSGSLDFHLFRQVFASGNFISNLVFIILFIGFGIKAGFVPFHTWLPKAHPAAPSHISGIMSGVMIKTGIYGILRILSLMSIPSIELSYFVLVISVLSALFGVLYAIGQHDLKRLLAYHSVENIGIIGIGIGIGMLGLAYHNNLIAILGFSGGILHILNHSIFKELLFFAAGAVYNKTHILNIEKLGGLIKTMPYTAILFLIGSVAICGLPPLNGFVSEFLIYLGMLYSFEISSPAVLIISILTIASLALVGTMALLCFTKAISIVFLGLPRSDEADSVKEEVSPVMLLPMGILALFTFLIGLFPQYALNLVQNPALVLLKTQEHSLKFIIPVDILKTISAAGFGFIILFILIYVFRTLLLKNKEVSSYKTWDCGYQAGNNRMQYTASSYASPFLSFLKPLFIKDFHIKKPKGLFPKGAHFKLHIQDIFEFYLINPVIKTNKKFLERFYWIQSGSTQQYILYGLLFLIVALIGMIGVN
ncbi:MAG: proton-conducting transporter membrane subunit [Candidatus Gastranaerophilales bacterium]|nr:proton-conducting transporter membrane subunit [Candidatus Gastranaerophilales bacterium]